MIEKENTGNGNRVFTLKVSPEAEKCRIDVYVSENLPELSRSRVKSLIEEGRVTINGTPAEKASTRVKAGDLVTVEVPPPKEWDVEPEAIPLDVVYEDDDILVINKERGMVVHPAAGHWQGTLVNAILNHCPDLSSIGGQIRPGIVHRLDKDTTGLLVVAKNERALWSLQQQIKERIVRREYLALLRGRVRKDSGSVDAPIGRHPVDRKKMAVVSSEGRGRRAVTDYEVISRFGDDYTLIVAKLRTGRTHQIRVHMCHIGHPVVGDPVYGRTKGELGLPGQALHAYKLGLYRSFDAATQDAGAGGSGGEGTDAPYMEFFAPVPEDFKRALSDLERKYGEELPKWLKDLKKCWRVIE